jgi:hypothetical protein
MNAVWPHSSYGKQKTRTTAHYKGILTASMAHTDIHHHHNQQHQQEL